MFRRAAAAAALAVLAGFAIAGPCVSGPAYSYRPASGGAAYSYRPVAAVKEIVFLEVVDTVFDLNAKDVFVFTGPVPVHQGVPVGIDGGGNEVRVLPGGRPAPKAEAKVEAKDGAKAGGSAAKLLASLQTSCASCHQEGVRSRGGVTLLDGKGGLAAKVNWKEVLAAVTAAKGGEARMPPADSGKPPLSAEAVEAVKLLADGKALEPSPPPREEVRKAPKAAEVDERLAAMVTRSCLKCHGGDKTEGKLSFRDVSAVTSTQWRESYRRVLKGEMPKGGVPLSDEEADLYLDQAFASAKAGR